MKAKLRHFLRFGDFSREEYEHLFARTKWIKDKFTGLPEDQPRLMVGENAIRVFALDHEKLVAVANRINAPTYAQLTEPLLAPPEGARSFAFRRHGTWD